MFLQAGQPRARSISRASMLTLALGVVALSGCGSSSSTSSSASSSTRASSTPAAATGGGGHALALASDPEGQLKYNTTALTAKAGAVAIAFTNMAPLAHNLTIASSSGTVLGATPTFQGSTKTLSLNLKPGTYKFYCTVPGHRAAGMEGTLTVQ
jgi:plastocyanin